MNWITNAFMMYTISEAVSLGLLVCLLTYAGVMWVRDYRQTLRRRREFVRRMK